jgi:hypothetical protein
MNEQEQQTPQVQNTQPQEYPPPNYLALAIVTTILCCQVFGIVSIVYAASVNSKWTTGDFEGARAASKNAKLWALIGIGSAIFAALIIFAIAIIGILADTGFLGIDI